MKIMIATLLIAAGTTIPASAQYCRWNGHWWRCPEGQLQMSRRPHGAPNAPFRPRGRPCPIYQRDCWYGPPTIPPLTEDEQQLVRKVIIASQVCRPL